MYDRRRINLNNRGVIANRDHYEGSYTSADYMIHEAPVIYGATSLSKATEIICDTHLTGLPVVDKSKKLIGFISEQNCIQKLLTSSYHCEFNLMATGVMQTSVNCSSGDGIIDLAASMQDDKPKIYSVVTEGKLLGKL